MKSKDVIHAFWIPAFRIQEDVVPGITNALARDPVPARELPGRLQLLCGLGHSLMRSTVHVVSEEDSTPGSPARAAQRADRRPLDIDRRDFGIMWATAMTAPRTTG